MSVPFELPDASYAAYTWEYESEHNPASQPPLTLSVPGMDFATDEAVPASIKVNGYNFFRAGARPTIPRIDAGPPELTPFKRWQQFWLPRLDAHVAALLAFDPSTVERGNWRATLDALERETAAIFLGVHMTCVFGASSRASRFLDAYAGHMGEERRADGLAMLHGIENATSSRAGAIWELSRIIAADAGLRAELGAWHSGERVPSTGRFDQTLAGVLERWGLTVDGSMQDTATWREDPTPVIAAAIEQATMDESHSPIARQQEARDRRAALEEELRALADGSGQAFAVRAMLPGAQEHVAVSEDHNVLCDQRLIAASRLRWMAVGRHLQERGRVTDPGDVFYHTLDELLAALEDDIRLPQPEIQARIVRQREYRSATPPRFLGRDPGMPEAIRGAALPGLVLKGIGASRGKVRGRALVAGSLDQASALRAGDVLVCRITAPAWTPLFSIAGAVVTDVGGVLSHPAIVAREFGIPAVVGCRDAMARLTTGCLVEVDGTAGTVLLVEAAPAAG